MSSPSPAARPARRTFLSAVQLEEYFAPQRTSTADLPSPEMFVRNAARGFFEVHAGVREVEQLARWMTEEVYRTVAVHAALARRARSARGTAPRDVHEVRSVRLCSPADGVVEAAVTGTARDRTRVLAMRIEGRDGRWRVTACSML